MPAGATTRSSTCSIPTCGRCTRFYLFSASTGSTDGLKTLNMGYTDIAWSHLYDPESGEYNIPFLPVYTPNVKPVVVNLFYRELGFLTAAGNPHHIKGFEDLARKKIRFINRQKGSGTRKLIDHNLAQRGIDASAIRGYDDEVNTHLEIGLSIISGEADVGIATVAVSKLLSLAFVPITRERFDMILGQQTFFQGGVQTLMEVLKIGRFPGEGGKAGELRFQGFREDPIRAVKKSTCPAFAPSLLICSCALCNNWL